MRQVTIFFLLFLSFVQIKALDNWYRRHIIVLQDNSGSFYTKDNEILISDIQKQICSLFQNQTIGNNSLLQNENEQGGAFFDPSKDLVSFYWFVADQFNNVLFYETPQATIKDFEKYFLSKGSVNYCDTIPITEFLLNNFRKRPERKSYINNIGIWTYSFSAYAYPLCMDIVKDQYSEEYVVILISDFNAGSTFGNRKDEKIIKDAFKNKADIIIRRVNELNSELFKIDYFDYYKSTKNDGLIGFIGLKIRPFIGAHIPESVDLRVNSNIELIQKGYGNDTYTLKNAEVIFDHNDKANLNEVYLWVKLNDNDQAYITNVSKNIFYDYDNNKYIFKNIDLRLNSKTESSQSVDGELKFLFHIEYKTGSENTIKYVYNVGRNINNTNIIFQTKITNAQIFMMIILFILGIISLIIFYLYKDGKPRGIALHWYRFNDNYETVDFSAEGTGRVHTDYHAWNQTDNEKGLCVKVEGKYLYNHPGRFYNWKEQTGFPIRITPSYLEHPEGYSMYLTTENKVTNNSNVSLETDTFENGRFSFKVMIKKEDFSPVKDPQQFKFQIEVVGRSVGFIKKFFYTKYVSYIFHIGPELGDIWVGVDPGTTGSCIATATESADLTMEKTNFGRDLITPSVIVIKTEDLRDGTNDSIRDHTIYGTNADIIKVNDKSKNYKKFISIKKLLGYNESFLLKKIGESEIRVKSSFLSTLLIEGLFRQHKKFLESQPKEYGRFLESGKYAPKRAVFAIPNNFTATKIQHLKNCIQSSNLTSLKDIRFIYEAEAILINQIHEKTSKLLSSASEENIFIFDMGGATINATLANVKKRNNIYEINIIAKLGYGIGGDTIDYAFLKWIYSKSDKYPSLAQNNPFSSQEMDMEKRIELKGYILELKKQLIKYYSDNNSKKLLDRKNLSDYFGAELKDDNSTDSKDEFEMEIKKDSPNFLDSVAFNTYVWINIESIVKDIIIMCKNKGIENINTVIMTGRSSHFPKVKEKVQQVIKSTFPEASIELLELDKSKSAVAKGACYYGVENAKIKLNNRGVNGVFGVIQTLGANIPPIFHRLIDDGANFQNGVVMGNCPIKEEREFDWDGKKVRFCQVMGVDAEKVIENREKHKYTEIATIKAQPYAVKSVHISVTEKDKVICSVTNVNNEISNPTEGVVNDADIVACNDQQYTFFIK